MKCELGSVGGDPVLLELEDKFLQTKAVCDRETVKFNKQNPLRPDHPTVDEGCSEFQQAAEKLELYRAASKAKKAAQ